MDGNWASTDGVFVATFQGGRFTSRFTQTNEILAQGTYTVTGSAVSMQWVSVQAQQQRSANCSFTASDNVACSQADGGELRPATAPPELQRVAADHAATAPRAAGMSPPHGSLKGSDMAKKTVGFIGLGLMGHGMAKNILAKGNDLLVMAHRNRAPVDDLVAQRRARGRERRARWRRRRMSSSSASPAARRSRRSCAARNGIKAGAKRGLLVIDTSTSDPVSTKALAAELAATGVDAGRRAAQPHAEGSGGRHARLHGRRATMRISRKAKPVIECFAAKIVHVGPVGAGHTMKLLNNFVSIGYATIYSEALALGARVGISPAQFHAVIGGGRMSCGFYDTFMKYVVERDRDAHKFTLANAHKDMRYLADLAERGGRGHLRRIRWCRTISPSAEAMGKGGDYLPMLSDHVAALNGVSLAPK